MAAARCSRHAGGASPWACAEQHAANSIADRLSPACAFVVALLLQISRLHCLGLGNTADEACTPMPEWAQRQRRKGSLWPPVNPPSQGQAIVQLHKAPTKIYLVPVASAARSLNSHLFTLVWHVTICNANGEGIRQRSSRRPGIIVKNQVTEYMTVIALR